MASQLERTRLLVSLRERPDLIPKIYELCRRDILYWFDWFAITFDPRPDPATKKPIGIIPFNLYPFQREAVLTLRHQIDNGEDILIEKCRDMGISWTVLIVFFWYWLFHSDTQFRVGSRNINEVDKPGDPSTMFEKLRMELREQPDFLLPEGFVWVRHATFTRLINPENGSTIIGETANPSFGRSARNTAALFDELAFWEADDAAWASAGATTQCRIGVSTPYGQFNRFARMALGKIDDKPRKLTFFWWLNPRHDQVWYDKQKARYTKSELAREVEISYTSSLEGGIFSDVFTPQLHVVPLTTAPTPENPDNLWIPNPDYPLTISFDFGRTNAALFTQIDSWYNVDVFHEIVLERSSTEDLAQAVLAVVNKYNALHPNRNTDRAIPRPIERVDNEDRRFDYRRPFSGDDGQSYSLRFTADPAGKTSPWQEVKAFSDHDILAGYNIRPLQYDKVIAAKNRKYSAISLVQSFLMRRFRGRERLLIRNPDKCPILIQALSGEYRYKTDNNGDVTDTVHEIHPIEDVVDNLFYTLLQFADILPHQLENQAQMGKGVIKSSYEFPI